MAFPELPTDGQTPWGNQFRAWADAVELQVAAAEAAAATINDGLVAELAAFNAEMAVA